jgi:hypothetical protein
MEDLEARCATSQAPRPATNTRSAGGGASPPRPPPPPFNNDRYCGRGGRRAAKLAAPVHLCFGWSVLVLARCLRSRRVRRGQHYRLFLPAIL